MHITYCTILLVVLVHVVDYSMYSLVRRVLYQYIRVWFLWHNKINIPSCIVLNFAPRMSLSLLFSSRFDKWPAPTSRSRLNSSNMAFARGSPSPNSPIFAAPEHWNPWTNSDIATIASKIRNKTPLEFIFRLQNLEILSVLRIFLFSVLEFKEKHFYHLICKIYILMRKHIKEEVRRFGARWNVKFFAYWMSGAWQGVSGLSFIQI